MTEVTAKDSDFGDKVHISSHPVISHKITTLRSSTTRCGTFRAVLRELTYHLGYEATSRLSTKPVQISVPVKTHEGEKHVDHTGQKLVERVALIPILRSGQGMVEAMTELLPNAAVHHIGMYKVTGANPVQYYNKLPRQCDADVAFILDPSIITSQTTMSVIQILKKWGVKEIHVISVLASRSGLRAIVEKHPDVYFSLGAIDEVTETGELLPGMGDAGDRQFGTVAADEDEEELMHPSRRKRTLSEAL
ncbi:uracil phosphoribosyltransferase [Fistulifera solaris]|uniref:Uracil phosphoribosyltransferase n=1 Tax=Fistulifera solaris TaxID=1519565 RepID=A0A1Z5KLR1_FISSO|nr:uracil phosphoribosyltransferase [Fistulifera solaris]|eukprot:GAX27253.1 uracil phosphoribosyltransferase [Fistulifera solaris]